jgi:hypothetical protein
VCARVCDAPHCSAEAPRVPIVQEQQAGRAAGSAAPGGCYASQVTHCRETKPRTARLWTIHRGSSSRVPAATSSSSAPGSSARPSPAAGQGLVH